MSFPELQQSIERHFAAGSAAGNDPAAMTAFLSLRSALESGELQAVARLANDIAAWQALLQSPPARLVGKLVGLSELSTGVTLGLRTLAESIERKIQPDGSLADDASPELGRIRREQERQQRVIEESLRAALRKLSSDGATQDDLGFYVIPGGNCGAKNAALVLCRVGNITIPPRGPQIIHSI